MCRQEQEKLVGIWTMPKFVRGVFFCIFRMSCKFWFAWWFLQPVSEIGNNVSMTDAEKELACSQLLSTAVLKYICFLLKGSFPITSLYFVLQAQCPLGVRHPPTGIEFGMGCSMCEDNKVLLTICAPSFVFGLVFCIFLGKGAKCSCSEEGCLLTAASFCRREKYI